MKTIPLTQGFVAIVDDADFEAVSKFKWYAARRKQRVYAARNAVLNTGRRTIVYLHRELMGVPKVDHRDGDGLNNQRHNLRPATYQENIRGFRRKQRGATSEFRGVSWHRGDRRWRARIHVDGVNFGLGNFVSQEDAARAYDEAARKHFGEFASPNFA